MEDVNGLAGELKLAVSKTEEYTWEEIWLSEVCVCENEWLPVDKNINDWEEILEGETCDAKNEPSETAMDGNEAEDGEWSVEEVDWGTVPVINKVLLPRLTWLVVFVR